MDTSEIQLVIHPDKRVCTHLRFDHQGNVIDKETDDFHPHEFDAPLQLGSRKVVAYYYGLDRYLASNYYYDGGEEAFHLAWVYINRLRKEWRPDEGDDDFKLQELFKMFGEGNQVRYLMIDEHGEHFLYTVGLSDHVAFSSIQMIRDTHLVVGREVIPATEFFATAIAKSTDKLNARRDKILSVPEEEQ